VPPFTGNAGVTLQASQSVQIGQPPTGQIGQVNTGIPIQSPATSALPDGNFAFDLVGNLSGQASTWAVQNTAPTPYLIYADSSFIRNDGGSSTGGIQNYLRLTGFSQIYTNLIVPTNQALYFSFTARSNNVAQTIVTQIESTGTGVGYANGTYTGIALNGASGTGATCSITIVSNVITSATITSGGSGYLGGSNFNVILTVGGGSGLVLVVSTGNLQVFISLTAYNSLGSVVSVSPGGSINYVFVYGPISSWTAEAAIGTFLFPANVAYVNLTISSNQAMPPTGYFDIANILLQPVQNQTVGTQVNSQYPQTQGSGMSAIYVDAPSVPQTSLYGLYEATINGSDGGSALLLGEAGDYLLQLSNGSGSTEQAQIGANSSSTSVSVLFGTNSIQFLANASGIQINTSGTLTINGQPVINGATVTTSAGTKNITEGWIT
jgi:hypothetical protein